MHKVFFSLFFLCLVSCFCSEECKVKFIGHACFKAVKLGVNVANSCLNSHVDVFLDGSFSV